MSAREEIEEAARRRIESPCIGVCVIDSTTETCEGCFRTLDEIAAWGTSSAGQRRQILAKVARREAEHTTPEV